MDPQGRVLLEQAGLALHDATARTQTETQAATGVYVGVMHMEYIQYMAGAPIIIIVIVIIIIIIIIIILILEASLHLLVTCDTVQPMVIFPCATFDSLFHKLRTWYPPGMVVLMFVSLFPRCKNCFLSPPHSQHLSVYLIMCVSFSFPSSPVPASVSFFIHVCLLAPHAT